MAEPARESAADTGPGTAAPGRPDPLAPGWVDVRVADIAGIEAVTLSVGLATEMPEHPAVLALAAVHLRLMEALVNISRRCVLDEGVLGARERAAYERGVADCKAARCHLEAVPGPG